MARDPYDIQRIFEQMALDLIASLRRNFVRHRKEEINEGFRWDRWQLVKLRNLAKYRGHNSRIVRDAFKAAEKLTEDVTNEGFRRGERSVTNLIRRLFRGRKREAVELTGVVGLPVDEKPLLIPPDIDKYPYEELPRARPETQFFSMNERKLEALQESVKNDFKQAERGVLRKMDDVYRQVVYRAEVNMASGAKTLDQAIDMATKEFLDRGIDTITYSDGRKMNIASWAEMALRTASQRATFLGEGKKRDEFGVYTVLMSSHDNCSPWCLPYQGTVMIDDVYTSLTRERAEQMSKETGYTLLSAAMKDGAFHPNCRHSLTTFYPGISRIPDPVDSATAEKMYKAEQHQRYIERNIRKYKRLASGSIADENIEKYKKKVREWEVRLEEHLDAYPQLRRDRKREVDRTAV